MKRRFALSLTLASCLSAGMGLGEVHAEPARVVKIAFIDPLSGPFAEVGRNQLRSWQFLAEQRGADALPRGVRFQVVGFDNKGSPQESLNAAKAAIDQGFRYIAQGNGSGAAAAILEVVNKHNARHPGREVLYLNYAAVDPALTNERCSFWHVRLDADTSMKMEALTTFLATQPSTRRVYLINQNYAHGQQVSAYFRESMARKRPEVQVVGDDLHPLGQVKDFSPWAERVRLAQADAIVTGNWGADLTRLVQALQQAGLRVPLYAYYPAVSGTPKALARWPGAEVYQIGIGHSNPQGELARLMAAFRARHGEDLYTFAIYNGIELLGRAMAQANSTDPDRVARALGGLRFQGANGPSNVRADDHQVQQGLWVSRWVPVSAAAPYSVEGTGYTFAPLQYLPAQVASRPTRCDMARP